MELKYAIWNANFQLLADWQFEAGEKIVLARLRR